MSKETSSDKLPYGLTNLKGSRIGDLRVIGRTRTAKGKRPRWRCECLVCGNRITVAHNRLIHKTNPKLHCGCKRKGPPSLYKVEYHAWWDAKERCHNENHPSYPQYGAKGVVMCDAWRESFESFLAYVGERPTKKHSLDRIDAFGNYEPGNVRWATLKTQARNKRGTKYVKHPQTGKLLPAATIAEQLGMSYQQFRNMMIEKGEW